jgi:hypothetical protein
VVRERLHHKLEAALPEAADRVAFELVMNLFGRYEALGLEPPNFEFIRMKDEWAQIITEKMHWVSSFSFSSKKAFLDLDITTTVPLSP